MLGTLALVALLLAGCGDRASHALVFGDGEDNGPFGMTIPNVPERTPFTFAGMSLCVRGGAPVTLTGVRAVEPTDIAIDGFAVSDEATGFGADVVDLKDAGFDPKSHRVTVACTGDHAWLAVQVSRTSRQKAMMSSLVVEYIDASGRRGELKIPCAVTLCGPGDKSGSSEDWTGACVDA